jgi:hypothetical protein
MKTLSPDTSPEVERIMIEGYRMTAWKKLKQVLELTQLVRQLVMNDIRRRRVQRRWYNPYLGQVISASAFFAYE